METGRATAVVAVVVAAVLALGAGFLRPGDEPAGAARRTADAGVAPPAAPTQPGRPLAVEAAGSAVWLLAEVDGCRCTALWRHGSSGWERLHDFPGRRVGELAFSLDGRLGLVAAGERLWASTDFGLSWQRKRVPDPIAAYVRITVTDRHFWVRDSTGSSGPWRAPATGVVRRLEGPGGHVLQLVAADDVVVALTGRGQGHDITGVRASTSGDGGRSWIPLPLPCASEASVAATRGAVFVTCVDGRRAVVHRLTAVGSWRELGAVRCCHVPLLPVTPHRLLDPVTHTLVTERGTREVDLGLARGAAVTDAATGSDGTVWLATTAGVITSADHGLTWAPMTGVTTRS